MGGGGATYDYGFRIYNSSIGRFLSVDPLTSSYPWYTPYQFAGNKPIIAIDLDGLEEYYATDGTYMGNVGGSTEIRIVDDTYLDIAQDVIGKANSPQGSFERSFMIILSQSFSEYAENVSDVLNDAPLETWADNGYNCNAAARQQMADAKVETNGSANVIQTDVDNSAQTSYVNGNGNTVNRPNLTENKIGGAIYVMTQLKAGNPVMVGAREATSTSTYTDVHNNNALTGHFFVISSMQVNGNNVTFGYYDNANEDTGKSSDNRLNVNTTTGAMTDDTNIPVGGVSSYEVSEVRTNKNTTNQNP